MKQFKDYNEIQKIKIKKILIYNHEKIDFNISDNDIVEFEGLNLLKIIKENKEYLFKDNIILNP